jgi:hypothetical protein
MTPTAAELLDDLERRGVRLEVDGAGRLVYRAPKGAVTAELRTPSLGTRRSLCSR